jgi:hypothetical protein
MMCCVECVMQHVSWLVIVQVLGAPRWPTVINKIKCKDCVLWKGMVKGG